MESELSLAVALTAEQLDIVRAAADRRILVQADAGTGKTTVLVERLRALLSAGALPGSGILVLTFARAVVRKLRLAMRQQGDATYVRAQTFDSFATQVLANTDPGGAWRELGFDDRITLATTRIAEGAYDAGLTGLVHIFVDELQDLLEERAKLVGAILHRSVAGATLFVDPAQSIYDFEVSERPNGIKYAELAHVLTQALPRPFEIRRLTRNFRAQGDLPRQALRFGPDLCQSPPPLAIGPEMQRFWLELPVETLRSAAAAMRERGGSSAILTRTNGEALVISGALAAAGVPHVYQRRADDRAVARWLGAAMACLSNTSLNRERFEGYVGPHLPPELSIDDAWRLVRKLDGTSTRAINVHHLAERILVGDVPDELNEVIEDGLVTSTVHRAKGLEFDNVAIVGREPPGSNEDRYEEELRVLYVALTRPRHTLVRIDHPTNGMYRHSDGRWFKARWREGAPAAVELRGSDVDMTDPPGLDVPDSQPADVQQRIRDMVRRGDAVDLMIHRRSVGGQLNPIYKLIHATGFIGSTSTDFGRSFARLLRGRRPPERLNGLRVELVDTVAGTEAAARRAGLGPAGIWLRVRIQGLGEIPRVAEG